MRAPEVLVVGQPPPHPLHRRLQRTPASNSTRQAQDDPQLTLTYQSLIHVFLDDISWQYQYQVLPKIPELRFQVRNHLPVFDGSEVSLHLCVNSFDVALVEYDYPRADLVLESG